MSPHPKTNPEQLAPNDRVRHRLYPELGTGVIERILKANPPLAARVQWPTRKPGQLTTHALTALRRADR